MKPNQRLDQLRIKVAAYGRSSLTEAQLHDLKLLNKIEKLQLYKYECRCAFNVAQDRKNKCKAVKDKIVLLQSLTTAGRRATMKQVIKEVKEVQIKHAIELKRPEVTKQLIKRGAANAKHALRRASYYNAITPKTYDDQRSIATLYVKASFVAFATGIAMDVDHIRPLTKGGKHEITNLQILTASENRSKGNKLT